MIYTIIAVGLITILCYTFLVYRKKSLLKRMLVGVDIVKMGLYEHLSRRFNEEYGGETAGFLAAAVINELFSEPPSNPDAQKFLELHRDVVYRELSNLRNDAEVRNIVTQAVRVKVLSSSSKVY
jgi:hypothetical protein